MLEIVVCDDDIADLERAVNMLHKIFTSQKIAYHIEQFASANQMLENISNIDIGILDISMIPRSCAFCTSSLRSSFVPKEGSIS